MLNMSKTKKYSPYSSTYNNRKLFDGAMAKGVMDKSVLNLPTEDLEKIQKSWDAVRKANLKIKRENTLAQEKVIKQIEAFCSDLGLPTYARDNSGKEIVGEHNEFKMMKKQLNYHMPLGELPEPPKPVAIMSLNQEVKCPGEAPDTLLEFIEKMKHPVALQEERKLCEQINAAQSLVAPEAAADIAAKIRTSVENRKQKDIERKQWLAKTYKFGDPVKIEVCDDCDIWMFGHKRCSCGRHFIEARVIGEPGNYSLKFYSTEVIKPLIPDFQDNRIAL